MGNNENVKLYGSIDRLRGYLVNKELIPDDLARDLMDVLDYAEKHADDEIDYFKDF